MSSRYRWEGIWQYALIGVLGYALFGWLYARYSPAMHYGVTLDHSAALARAQTIAQELGRAAPNWEATASGSSSGSDEMRYYYLNNPHPEVVKLLSPARFSINFKSPNPRENLNVRLTSTGQLVSLQPPFGFGNRENSPRPGGPPSPPPSANPAPATPKPTAPTAEQAQLAESVFAQHYNTRGLFTDPPTVNNSRQGFTFIWKKRFAEDERITLLAEVEVEAKRVNALSLNADFSPAFQNEFVQQGDSNAESLLQLVAIFAALLAALSALATFFGSWGRREIPQAQALRLLFGTFLLLFTLNLLSGQLDSLGINTDVRQRWLASLLKYLIYTLLMLLCALVCYFAWAAGLALAGRRAGRRTVALELLLDGQFAHSYVSRQFVIGILLGSLVILPPFLLKMTLYRHAAFGSSNVFNTFGARAPWLRAFSEFAVLGLFLFFAYVVPLIESYLTRWPFQPILIIALGGMWMLDIDHFPITASAQWITGMVLTAVLYTLYRQHDLLTVIVASAVGYAVLQVPALLAQPQPTLRLNALAIIGMLAIALLVGLAGVWKGQALNEQIFEPLHAAATAAERERLKAEIAVATRAQQQMLPAAPPHVPGLEIAASCHPSKDVGGDLYDFLNLPDGRLGIVVADVSGKGVPAALYMTLTKGLLAAITEHESDPGAILREANHHLYEACRKKVFVTLFLGVYDPATRVLTYARAGHNPTVYRSRINNATELLKPRGMGLGLAHSRLFNPALAVASLQLAQDDLLFFYSDGITEAMNHKQDEYGEERLMEIAQRTDGMNAHHAHDAVLTDVKNFLGNVPPQDDQTLVVLRVLAA